METERQIQQMRLHLSEMLKSPVGTRTPIPPPAQTTRVLWGTINTGLWWAKEVRKWIWARSDKK